MGAGSCEVVVVVLWVAGGAWVVVEVVDCVVLCAITGSDRANTISDPRTTANRFLDFISFLLKVLWPTSMVRFRLPLRLSTIALSEENHRAQTNVVSPLE